MEEIDRHITIRTPEGERAVDIYSEEGLRVLADLWTRSGWEHKLSYEVTWLGVPIIQLPNDMVMVQELIWRVRPDVIVECGVAHGGALVLYASLCELMRRGRVIGIDIEIRKYNRLAIEGHPMSHRITLIERSSTDEATLDEVRGHVGDDDVVLVLLDSNHTRAHVRSELELYAPLVTPDSYIVVFDSVMASLTDAPRGSPDWTDDNPGQAVQDFLADHPEFEVDERYTRLLETYCRGGYLRRRR